MLFSLFRGGDFKGALIALVLILPAIVLCLMIHEVSHALAARAFGDRTAEYAGRLTLDPKAHIDPMGFLCMLLFGFGWARPVPINISNFKHKRAGMAVTALAGPLSNFVLAVLFLIFYVLLSVFGGAGTFVAVLSTFCYYVATLSTGLGVFNLIPVYPLDGAKILDAALPYQYQVKYNNFVHRYQSVLLLGFIALMWFGGLSRLISAVFTSLVTLVLTLFSFVLG